MKGFLSFYCFCGSWSGLWCALARFSRFRLSIDVVLSPCVHSGRRPKPRQARDGHSWRMAAALLVLPAGPASVLPTFTGGVWKAGVRSIRSEPCEGPRALLAVVRGGSREARRGLRRSLLARFAPPTVCGSVRPASLRAGGGSADVCRVTRPSRTGLCARVLLAILAVLLERSRPIFRGARY